MLLLYGDQLHGVTVLYELQDIQTKTLERLLQLKGLDGVTLHNKENVLFFYCRRKEQLLITLYNVLVLDQEPFSNVAIKYNDHRYATQAQQKDLYLPKPNAI